MVLTTPLAPGLAVQLAVPLNAVDQEVASIGATLALLSAAGVGLAALAGWGVARAGLAPVGRLAAVAEQVTATGDPASRVEVDRADELGRLATSFNTMLGALQRSLAAQRQLVSDASHELRTPLTSLRINAELLAAEPGLPAGRAPGGARPGRRPGRRARPAGRQRHRTGPGRAGRPARSATVRLDEVVAAALDGARRDWPQTVFTADLEPCAGLRQRRAAARSRSATCWTTRPSSARPAPRCEVRLRGRRAHRARPRTRDRARRPAARVRPLLPGGVGPRRARLGPRAVHRPPGGRGPRRDGPGRARARRRDPDPAPPARRASPVRTPPTSAAGCRPRVGAATAAGPGREYPVADDRARLTGAAAARDARRARAGSPPPGRRSMRCPRAVGCRPSRERGNRPSRGQRIDDDHVRGPRPAPAVTIAGRSGTARRPARRRARRRR